MERSKAIEVAKKYLGVTENPPNSNNVKFNTSFYGKEVSGSAYPWCCTFIWYIHKEAGIEIKKTASCMELGNWFKSLGRFKTANPEVGDIVFFKYSTNTRWTNHVGLVEKVNNDGSITTIEGNTSTKSNDNGGAVMRRTRKINSSVVGFGSMSESVKTKYPILRQGSRGADVVKLQKALNKYGYLLTEDGIFGSNTYIAVIAFQGLKGLTKDGVVGEKTWKALGV